MYFIHDFYTWPKGCILYRLLVWDQTEIRLVPDQSEKCINKLQLKLNKIQKTISICTYSKSHSHTVASNFFLLPNSIYDSPWQYCSQQRKYFFSVEVECKLKDFFQVPCRSTVDRYENIFFSVIVGCRLCLL